MIQYMSAREAAEKWNISQRRVSILCSENRIPNVAMLGNMWLIPRNAEKPADARMKRNNVDEKEIYPDRIACCDRHHRDSCGDAASGVESGTGKRTHCRLYQ